MKKALGMVSGHNRFSIRRPSGQPRCLLSPRPTCPPPPLTSVGGSPTLPAPPRAPLFVHRAEPQPWAGLSRLRHLEFLWLGSQLLFVVFKVFCCWEASSLSAEGHK